MDTASVPRGNGATLCLREELSAMNRQAYIVPIWMIGYLVAAFLRVVFLFQQTGRGKETNDHAAI